MMSKLYELGWRTNINIYHYNDKYIIVYDDHRTLLNVLFEAKHKLGVLTETPNLIYFDEHDDACLSLPKSRILKNIGVKNISNITSKKFWSFVEFDLSNKDDDWLLTGMELDLIKDAIHIGGVDGKSIHIDRLKDGIYKSEDNIEHQAYNICHLRDSLDGRGCLGDNLVDAGWYYKAVRDIMQYHYQQFDSDTITPFVLDFDLDCFSTRCVNSSIAWLEDIFCKEYVDNIRVLYFIKTLINRASFITICREPNCCGGLGESNKILGYLDRYFFDGALRTEPLK